MVPTPDQILQAVFDRPGGACIKSGFQQSDYYRTTVQLLHEHICIHQFTI